MEAPRPLERCDRVKLRHAAHRIKLGEDFVLPAFTFLCVSRLRDGYGPAHASITWHPSVRRGEHHQLLRASAGHAIADTGYAPLASGGGAS
jgi:hypothetical protein